MSIGPNAPTPIACGVSCSSKNKTTEAEARIALESEPDAAKYLNSPETPLFRKSKILFGLHRTKRSLIEAIPRSFAKARST